MIEEFKITCDKCEQFLGFSRYYLPPETHGCKECNFIATESDCVVLCKKCHEVYEK